MSTGKLQHCAFSGKIAYTTRAEAAASLVSMRRRSDPAYRGRPYRCTACRMWHFGRPEPTGFGSHNEGGRRGHGRRGRA